MLSFADEQRALGTHCWQFVGIADELAVDDAWIRRTLFGRDVFVQRFEDELRGYANICQHRGFPLRRTREGIGPVECGFHKWRYGRDGVPNHIPRNAELFGLSKEQRQALALPLVRVEAVGRFVFATWSPTAPTLRDYLGALHDVYASASAVLGPCIYRESAPLAASWKLHVEISLDDYHIESVHPTTFGAAQPLQPHNVVYQRAGLHSWYLKRRDANWSFDGFWRDVREGRLDRAGYKIFNPFPGGLFAVMREGCFATSVTALAEHASVVDAYLFAWADPDPATVHDEVAAYYADVFREDRQAVERWAHAVPGVRGKFEERIGWFYDALGSISG